MLCLRLPLILRPNLRAAEASSSSSLTRKVFHKAAELVARGRYPLWLFGGITTGAGRVIADVHWGTDTLAGACLGVALVSATAMVSNKRT